MKKVQGTEEIGIYWDCPDCGHQNQEIDDFNYQTTINSWCGKCSKEFEVCENI